MRAQRNGGSLVTQLVGQLHTLIAKRCVSPGPPPAVPARSRTPVGGSLSEGPSASAHRGTVGGPPPILGCDRRASLRPLIARRPRVLSGSFVLEDVDPLELARQLTLIDWEKFRAIAPRECLEASSKQKACMQQTPAARRSAFARRCATRCHTGLC